MENNAHLLNYLSKKLEVMESAMSSVLGRLPLMLALLDPGGI